MKKRVTIKLCDGFTLNYDGEKTDYEHISDIFDVFGWDTENDPNAKECADIICREMFCFGFIDLSPMCNGKHICTITAIPTQGDGVIKEEIVEEE